MQNETMSGGDGLGGLAVAIFIAMALIVSIAVGVAFLIARLLTKRIVNRNARWLATIGIVAMGLVIGGLAVVATFFESKWSPPDEITFRLPPNFNHPSVYLIEDNRATQSLEWRGVNLPLMSRSASIDVPASGVVRVKSLNMPEIIQLPNASFSNGERSTGSFSTPAPATVGTGIIFGFTTPNGGFMPSGVTDDKWLTDDIRVREGKSR
jgi:hypothetical protein